MVKFLKKAVRKVATIKPRNFSGFLSITQEKGCKTVRVTPGKLLTWDAAGAEAGYSDHNYCVEFRSATHLGRPIFYRETCFRLPGSVSMTTIFPTTAQQIKGNVKLLNIVEGKLKELRDALPGVSVELANDRDEVVDIAALYEETKSCAKEAGVNVYI